MTHTEAVASGLIQRGRLKIRQTQDFSRQLAGMRDGEVLIRVERVRATRSVQQNRWYFGCVLALLSEHTGYHVDELHEYFKGEFLRKTMLLCNEVGEIIREGTFGQSTTTLTTITFGEYVDRIRQVAAEMGCVIPDPDPDYWMKEDACSATTT